MNLVDVDFVYVEKYGTVHERHHFLTQFPS